MKDRVPGPAASSALESLPGIGPARARKLAAAGLTTVEDLLLLAPRRYEDRSRMATVEDLRGLLPGECATLLLEVESARLIRTRRRGLTLVRARLSDPSGAVDAVWFNQPYLARHLTAGRRLFLYGALSPLRGRGRPEQMENPEIELVGDEGEEAGLHSGRVVPVHRSQAGLSARVLRRLLHGILASSQVAEFLPVADLVARGWPSRQEALAALHFPPPGAAMDDLAVWRTPAQRRLIYEEFLLLALAFKKKKAMRRARSSAAVQPVVLPEGAVEQLPFTLTAGQVQALRTILADLSLGVPMARLLQGDVGCGKTVVAAMAALAVARAGRQVAVMVPTEVLAAQFRDVLGEVVQPFGLEVGLLTSGVTGAASRQLRSRLAAADLQMVVGTHALLQEDVDFVDLGLAIIDEQQRFGVSQRLALIAKGKGTGLLVMTATPIPRSLALAVYGDLDLIEIRDRPANRGEVITEVWDESRREDVWRLVRAASAGGRQVFIVHPLVEESASSDLAAARSAHRDLAGGALAGLSLGLLHGGMAAAARSEVMMAFASGAVQVLVTTSIIEVGVDVPTASLMVVEHADRFGLAQLHQLRGRVGRDAEPGRCILLHAAGIPPETLDRLGVLERTRDGFLIAREDLSRRGPGELLGVRQHGAPTLRLGDLSRDAALMDLAQEDAARLWPVADGALRRAMMQRWGQALDLADAG